MKIFITGIGGFIGSNLAKHWQSLGHEVSGSVHSASKVSCALQVVPLALDEPFREEVFSGYDLLVHAAHDFSSGAMEKNIRGTHAFADAAVAQGVRHQIFLSSHSARENATSEYGRTKFELEKYFLASGHAVLSPGLVVGNGGLFVKQRASLLRTPVMPVLGKRDDPVALIALDHFLAAATTVAEQRRKGLFQLFYDEQPSMREYVRAVKKQAGQNVRFVPIPIKLALLLVRAIRAIRIPIPVHPDQIHAISLNRSAAWRSDLPGLLPDKKDEFNLHYALSKLLEPR